MEKIRLNQDNVAVLNERISVDEEGTLHIKHAELSDTEKYVCRAENGYGEPIIESGLVEVRNKTEVLQPPKHAKLISGKDHTFDCFVKVIFVKKTPILFKS